jgi:pimeloyl-ACP methyl ester carboxylesterase
MIAEITDVQLHDRRERPPVAARQNGGVDLARVPVIGRLSARRRPLALLVVVVALAVLAGTAVVLVGHRHRSPVARQDQPGTVVLVPGYGGNTGSLTTLADRLRSDGRVAVVVTLPGQGNGDFIEQADALGAVVTRVLDEGAPSVDLIGYSAGGVVVRLWLSRTADARSVRRVVTLGSPLHGTTLAGVGSTFVPGACPTACQQLVPGSTLLTQLDAAPVPVPWLSVWTRDDQTVTPPDSARLAGAVNVVVQDVCADAVVQHGQLPSDPMVVGLLVRALGTGPVTQPGPVDCAPLRQLGAAR